MKITLRLICVLLVTLLLLGCSNGDNKEPVSGSQLNVSRYLTDKKLSEQVLQEAFDYCISQIDKYIDDFTNSFPSGSSTDLIYAQIENKSDWVQGFWTGMLWLAYEMTGEQKYRDVAEIHVESFLYRIENKLGVDHHDMGFLYSPSCVAAYKLTGNERAKTAALLAADQLVSRYQETGQFIQAWGAMGAENNYRLIIDCLMNMPLLYWASEVTGDDSYAEIANIHVKTTSKVVIRDNYSTHHTFFFDKSTGMPSHGKTAQGYSDTSAWARGQAWGIYGFALSYAYTGDERSLTDSQNLLNFFLNNLPSDYIPCWDLDFVADDVQRDSSAATIAVCGMLQLSKYNTENARFYDNAVTYIMTSLIENYLTEGENSNGILLHAVQSLPGGRGVDECNIWGDYYFMEALVRLLKTDHEMYW